MAENTDNTVIKEAVAVITDTLTFLYAYETYRNAFKLDRTMQVLTSNTELQSLSASEVKRAEEMYQRLTQDTPAYVIFTAMEVRHMPPIVSSFPRAGD